MFDNTIYVSDVKEAFDKYDEFYGKYKESKDTKSIESMSPAIIAIVRRECQPVTGNTPRFNYIRGRFNSKNKDETVVRTTAVLDMKVTFDITVLGYDQYAVDTIVDELYMMLYSGECSFLYPSGAKSIDDPTKDEMVKSYIKIDDGGAYGEITEAVDTPHSGRVYRTTFSVYTYGGIFLTNERKRVLKVPVHFNDEK